MFRNARILMLPLAVLATTLAGCGGGSSSTVTPPAPPAGALKQVSSPAELEASIKSGFTAFRSQSGEALASTSADAGAGAGSGNFTGTYTQEQNVDEFDVVRYDGEHLYVAPRRFYQCCFAALEVPGRRFVSLPRTPRTTARRSRGVSRWKTGSPCRACTWRATACSR